MFKQIKLRTYIIFSLLLFALLAVASVAVSVWGRNALLEKLISLGTSDSHLTLVSRSLDYMLYYSFAIAVVVVLLAIGSFVFLRSRLVAPLKGLQSHFNAIAKGDLSQPVQYNSANELGELYQSLRKMQHSLIKTFAQVQSVVMHINSDSDHIASGNFTLRARIDEQAAALQETAASMEQLASTVRQNADNAHQANQLATTASTVAQRGGQAVGEVVNTMQGISASSTKIADIVGVIDSIAFQTNILALNAAVEAARAGEQGRGFAVVASEVRALAQRSAQAAREITALIEDSVRKVSEGSGQVERAGETMHEIVDSVKRVTDIMGEISAATIEQSSGIEQVNLAVSQMDASTTQNAQMVENTATAATDLSSQVHQLNYALASYKLPELLPALGKEKNVRARSSKESSREIENTGKKALAHKSRVPLHASGAKRKNNEIPGMNLQSGGKNAQLLRPDLSNPKNSSSEDEWVEF